MNAPTNANNNNIDDFDEYLKSALPSIDEYFEKNNNKYELKRDTNNKIIFEPFSFDNSGKNNIKNDNTIDNTITVKNDIFISLINIKSAKKIDYIKFDPYKLYSEDFFNLKKNYINEVKFLKDDNIGENSDFFLNIGGGQNDSETPYKIKTRTDRLESREKSTPTSDTSILIFGLVDENNKPIDRTIMYTKTTLENLNNLKDLSTNIGVIDNTTLKKIGNVLGRGAIHTAKGAIIAKDYLTKKGIEGAMHTARGAIIAKDYLTKKGIEGALHTAKGATIAKDYLTNTFLQNITKNSSNTGGKRKKNYNHRLTKKINTKNYNKSKKYRK